MTRNKAILNLGAGKVNIDDFDEYGFVIHLDQSYAYGIHESIKDIEEQFITWCSSLSMGTQLVDTTFTFSGEDLFSFMDSFKFKINHINADRIFEHLFYDSGEIGRMLDACNQLTTDDGTLTIIVPNAFKLSIFAKELSQLFI